MSRKRDRERQQRNQAQRRRTIIVAGASVVAVLAVLGLMNLVSGTNESAASTSGAGGDPALVAAANLRPCPTSTTTTAVAGGLPAESLPCLGAGSDFSLASLTGKPAIVNVWGSWCPPCREELPWFASLDKDAAGQLQIVGVDVSDTADSALTTLADLGVHYPSVFDPQGRTRISLQWAGGTPVTLFVRADGTIAHRVEGRVPDEATLRALAAEHLGVAVAPN